MFDVDPAFLMTLGSREQDAVHALATDSNGNIYIAGTFEESLNFGGGGDGSQSALSGSHGSNDAFVAKYSARGRLRWVKHIGNGNFDSAQDLVVDEDRNLYIVGEFQGRVDFDPSRGREILRSADDRDGSPTQDAYVLKLDNDGDLRWVRKIGGRGFDEVRAVAVDDTGVYATGAFVGTVDFDPSQEKVRRRSDGKSDVFVLKLSRAGKFRYVRRIGAEGDDIGMGLAVDDRRNAYVTGQSSAADGNAFVSRLDRNGGSEWFRRIGGSSLSTAGRDIALAEDGDVVSIGVFQGTADFDPSRDEHLLTSSGFTDAYVSRLNRRGRFVWAGRLGGTGIGNGVGIAVAEDGDIYATGTFTRTADFDPGDDRFNLTSDGDEDVYVVRLSGRGRFRSAYSFGGNRQDTVADFCLGDDDSIYLGGFFKGKTDFDPGSGGERRRSEGDFDLFVVEHAEG